MIAARHAVSPTQSTSIKSHANSSLTRQGIKVLVLSLVTNIVVNTPYRLAEKAVEAERAGLGALTNALALGGGGEKGEEVANHQEVSCNLLAYNSFLAWDPFVD